MKLVRARVRFVLGVVMPLGGLATRLSGQGVLRTFQGDVPAMALGWSVAGAGDVDRDGVPDVIVGAPINSWSSNRPDPGLARVYSGRDSQVLYEFHGSGFQAHFGIAVDGAGDVNRDGWPDLVVGASYADSPVYPDTGSVTVFSGRDGSVLHAFSGTLWQQYLGAAVAGVGDLDGDGCDDIAAGAPCWADNFLRGPGYARVFSGRDGHVLVMVQGTEAGDNFGAAVEAAGDVDRDGVPDFIVGAPYIDRRSTPRAGYARVFSGRTGLPLFTFTGAQTGATQGYSVAGAGDVDRDGHADLIVGAPDFNAGSGGRARLYSGRDGSLLREFPMLVGPWDQMGRSVRGCGDVDQDGVPDLVIGAVSTSWTGYQAGCAWVHSGRDGRVLGQFHGAPGSLAGFAVDGAGDVDRDGLPDIVVGAPYGDGSQPGAGLVRVHAVQLLAGVQTVGTGCGAQGPPTMAATPPAMGHRMTVWGASLTPNRYGYCVFSAPVAAPFDLGLGCRAWVGPQSFLVAAVLDSGVSGSFTFFVDVPMLEVLQGRVLAAQSIFLPTSGPLGVDLTNALHLQIGR